MEIVRIKWFIVNKNLLDLNNKLAILKLDSGCFLVNINFSSCFVLDHHFSRLYHWCESS